MRVLRHELLALIQMPYKLVGIVEVASILQWSRRCRSLDLENHWMPEQIKMQPNANIASIT